MIIKAKIYFFIKIEELNSTFSVLQCFKKPLIMYLNWRRIIKQFQQEFIFRCL